MTGKPLVYVLVVLLLCLFCSVPVLATPATGKNWAPWVTLTTTSGATINWQQATSGTGTIAYANASYYNQYQTFDKTVTDPTVATFHHVALTGLEPGTVYQYNVTPSGNAILFGTRMFRTLPVSGPFTFIVISDAQEGHNYTEVMRFKYVADAVANETDVLFILHGGDYAGHDSPDLWNTYFQVASGMLAKSAIFTTIGNHEYHNSSNGPPTNAAEYHSSYNVPLNYSFDCAGVRFVVLNSPDPNNTNGDDPHTSLALATSQKSWLEGRLATSPGGTFTIHHHPIWDYYNTSNNPDLQPWEDLYHTYNISATFAGHTHNYQRYSVMGIPYFIVGDAGGRFADLNSTGPPPVWYQYGDTRKLGYLRVFVDPANNTATATEIFVASVQQDDSNETPSVYTPPVIADSITFPLSTELPPRVPEPGTGGSSDSADSGWTSSYSASAQGASSGQTMTFAINQPITAHTQGAFTSVSVVPSGALGPTQITVADAPLIDMSPLARRQTVYTASLVLVGVNPSAISQSTITFAVAGNWLSQHGVKPEDIVLMRGHDGQWSELATSFDHRAGNTYSFTATTPGFSYFAITTRAGTSAVRATALSATPAATATTTAETLPATLIAPAYPQPVTTPVTTRTTPVPAPAVDPTGPSGSPFLVAVAGIVGIAIIAAGGFFVRRWWIRRQNPALFRDYDEPRES